MPTSKRTGPRVAVLADSDTRWKWGLATARRLLADPGSDPGAAPGADPAAGPTGHAAPEITGLLLRGRATPTRRQLAEVARGADTTPGADPAHRPVEPASTPAAPREVTCAGFLAELAEDPWDVVVLALVGGTVQAVLHGVRAALPPGTRRPVLVTGYVGVVYEKLADGLLLRHGADLVLANSRHDAHRFREVYAGVGADAGAVTETALPFLGGAPYRGPRPEGPAATVVFAAQPSVPAAREDRLHLLRRAAEHARRHPDREVLVKLRSRPGEHTTHLEEHPYQRLAARLPAPGLPPNCRLVHGHMGEVLDRTDLLVTVSSTAALESLHRGIPTAVLTDLGVREPLGNHHFLGSGCLASWDELDAGAMPVGDPAWTAAHGVPGAESTADPYAEARTRLAALLAGPPLPPPAPWYDRSTAPGYLPALLARHHLAPDGRPLPGAPTPATAGADPVRRWLKARLREAARGAYRQGVQRVAPVIRRMGEL
ncbi:DUF6716 putative glycosyltransferase [Streptomyces sp. BI20]|uniref:DUF6716 putative glycosyltransferase n=1 Tax=Streptomyces sp. BI20 TaxID=3403460 RepID=UPI003C7924ED